MCYENPLHMAEEAAVVDLLSDQRLQLGISRGSPENATDGQAAFGYELTDGQDWGALARDRGATFMRAIQGEPMATSQAAAQRAMAPDLPVRPLSPGLADRIWWGAGTHATGEWAGQQGYNMLSSTLLLQEDGRPFNVQQADQIRAFREAFAVSGRGGGLAAVTRSVVPVTNDDDRRYFWREAGGRDSVGYLDGGRARSGPSIVGDPEGVVADLLADDAVMAADYLLIALPSQLGVDYNAHLFENLASVGRELGWLAD